MKLIINADDFGFTKGNTEGIIEGHKEGIITSTTALCNMPYLEYGAKISKETTDLGIGVHLNLTIGSSLTGGKTITKDGKVFLTKNQFYSSEDINLSEVETEFRAQIERFIQAFNRKPTHLDSHHGVHDRGEIYNITMKLSNEYGIPVRRYSAFNFVAGFYGENATIEVLKNIIKSNSEETGIELMTHPGYCDLELYNNSSYNVHRVKELYVLCCDEIKSFIKENSIELVHY
ncbi:carbohydrate deacetylase [Clostridium folliculivorans]|uniref:carbohydrate deacetylase n=1 Tax=Clostridium folliculivorans TaxID=2886038 RepID=UPI0021C2E786|nr:carbohydrate deacetylase [Clostridium folliculivorans]GKU30457.1 carbohydrate deacetylase [Clostridium folliculivorans]